MLECNLLLFFCFGLAGRSRSKFGQLQFFCEVYVHMDITKEAKKKLRLKLEKVVLSFWCCLLSTGKQQKILRKILYPTICNTPKSSETPGRYLYGPAVLIYSIYLKVNCFLSVTSTFWTLSAVLGAIFSRIREHFCHHLFQLGKKGIWGWNVGFTYF